MGTDISFGNQLINAVKPDAHAIGAINGSTIDMQDYHSVAFLVVLADRGAAGTLAAKLQHSDDGSTGWADDDGSTGNIKAITQLVANGEDATMKILRPMKRFYRVVMTVAANAVDASVLGMGKLRRVEV